MPHLGNWKAGGIKQDNWQANRDKDWMGSSKENTVIRKEYIYQITNIVSKYIYQKDPFWMRLQKKCYVKIVLS